MRRKYRLCIDDGTYQDRRTGEEKTNYNEIGFAIENDDGRLSAKLHFIPGKWVRFFEDNSDRNRGGNKPQNRGGNVREYRQDNEPY